MTDRNEGAMAQANRFERQPGILRRRRFLIVGMVVVIALGYLGFTAFQGASMYYLTVDELLVRGVTNEEQVRVMGKVVDGSVEKDPETNTIRFTIADGDGNSTVSLPVVYSGVVPDAFRHGGDVVLDGRLTQAGTFEADSLIVKCPSKYEAEPGAQAAEGRD